MRISNTRIGYIKEKLIKPFGFKGGAVTDLRQVAVTIGDEEVFATGVSVQSILWSDSSIFNELGQKKGDILMYETTKRALKILKTIDFNTPYEATDFLFQQCYTYVIKKTKRNIKKTFILNALVAIDMALWLYYAKKNNINSFTSLTKLEKKHDLIASIPLITYTTTDNEIKNILDNGEFFLKVKIGNHYDWDQKRIKEIHDLCKYYETPYTLSKRPVIYVDANGRYESLDKLLSLVDYLDRNNILKDIGVFEEPFNEELDFDVSDIPCLFACDESAHSINEVKIRHDQGYKALALKPVAKTLSESLKMLQYAKKVNMKTFVADLTVNPFLLELNRNVAIRMDTLDSVNVGLLETNGNMNYSNWDQMITYHPLKKDGFITAKNGVFDVSTYEKNDGGIFMESDYYNQLADEVI